MASRRQPVATPGGDHQGGEARGCAHWAPTHRLGPAAARPAWLPATTGRPGLVSTSRAVKFHPMVGKSQWQEEKNAGGVV